VRPEGKETVKRGQGPRMGCRAVDDDDDDDDDNNNTNNKK
jgi:hypothetical protein